jgi:hypothetical protein
MADSFPCPNCSHVLNVADSRDVNGVRSVRCPRCFTAVPIRTSSGAPPKANKPSPPVPVNSPVVGVPAITAKTNAPIQQPLLVHHVPPAAMPVKRSDPVKPQASQHQPFLVGGLAVFGLLALIVGVAGLSGIFSNRTDTNAGSETASIKPDSERTPTPPAVSNSVDQTTAQEQPPSKSEAKSAERAADEFAVVVKPDMKKLPDNPVFTPSPGFQPKTRGTGILASARLLSLGVLFERLIWLDDITGKKTGMAEYLKRSVVLFGDQGIIRDKPCGAYVQINETGTTWALVLLLPVRAEDTFRQMLSDGGFKESRRIGELTELSVPVIPTFSPIQLPPQCYLRFGKEYAYLCLAGDPTIFASTELLALDPVFAAGEIKKLVTATVYLDQLPPQLREQIKNGRQQLSEKIESVDAATAEYGAQFVDVLMEFSNDVLVGKHQIQFSVDLGPSQISADLKLIGEPGSSLATNFEALAAQRSRFGTLDFEKAAVGVRLNLRLPKRLRDLLPAVVQSATIATLSKILDNPEEKAEHALLFAALGPTVAAGVVDAAIVMYGREAGQAGGFVGGVKVVGGRSLDSYFQETLKEPDQAALRSMFKVNAESVGDIQTHWIVGQARTPLFNSVFGDQPIYLAFGTDMVGYSAGKGGKLNLAQLLEAKSRPAPLAHLSTNLKLLLEMIPFPDSQEALKVLNDSDPGRMQLRLDALEDQLHLHFSITPMVLRVAVDRVPVSIRFAPAGAF